VNLSVPHFSAVFRRRTGLSPINYLIRMRIQRACELLDTSDLGVEHISRKVGYDDHHYFCRIFRKTMGTTASRYRKGGAEVHRVVV
jgi:transcriptional regulator GlxA family with amidase domain